MRELGENIDLGTIRVCGADFDGDVFWYLLVNSKPSSLKGAVAELVHYPIPLAKPIVDVNWMITTKSIVAEMLYSINISILNKRR